MEIQIASNPALGGGGYDIYIFDGDSLAQPIELIFVDMDASTLAQPTMRLGGREAKQFFQAMGEAMDKQGIKTEQDAHIEGKLEATKLHLADMRRLVFSTQHSEETT